MMSDDLKEYLRFLKWKLPYKRNMMKYHVNTLSFDDTINLILKERLSVSRFGDGEFRFMLSEDTGDTFEINSDSLAQNLKETLTENQNHLLICLPSVYNGLSDLKWNEKVFWQREVSKYLKEYYKYLDTTYVYGDAFFSRPYQPYSVSSNEVEKKFLKIKEIWNNRNVIIVEGELTRFGVGNDLLCNAKSIKRIIAPATNAFERIDSILFELKKELKKNLDDDLLILFSLGPTATVLSARVSNETNVQCIDIGHLDIEYEWFLRGSVSKVPIKGKYVNESDGQKFIDGEVSDKYLSEIICTIK
ncbi:glycosyltransferase [Companilactobacillus paralimentarius DSM 13238 = JCM 10415]|uniref:Glycosyltransferase n=1 Tax=Companilactobacillus paralimentarius DSM 13238 = JCM 10415 TaxID=1122151 RepID=A0A0R1PFX0_9LACO|nr:GT-D fold domain-containing glycosyltransferase [Companilactobacillus paralimentarius]KAE9556818.1 hypothetical protein ATN96_02090 [Companilactobacillus paralimentarius]KAE9565546.1 hypothetical protein ATN96_02865 [Companilactobacillus paralimentarius]KRL31383.1 glycosyltransferase [Companilactobacillus paralimentarius DSM 13238 = JCM 10415]